MDTWEQFGADLRDLREREGRSLRDVAAAAGGDVTKSAIARIETGERVPSAQTLVDLARALDLRITIDRAGVVELRPLGRRPKPTSS